MAREGQRAIEAEKVDAATKADQERQRTMGEQSSSQIGFATIVPFMVLGIVTLDDDAEDEDDADEARVTLLVQNLVPPFLVSSHY